MAIYPGPGAIIENEDQRIYYTYAQFHKATQLSRQLQKLQELGEPIDGQAVVVALCMARMELIDTSLNKKASVRFVKPGEENQ